MSILGNLLNELTGSTDTSTVDHPCSNCPSTCNLAPGACSVCQPYKEKLIDALYNVEHKEELLSRYEVVGVSDSVSGSVVCPYCGGPTTDPYTCEYCGSALKEGSGKIKVSSASELPNPVLDAQNIIFERYAAVYGSTAASTSTGGILDTLLDTLLDSSESTSSLGSKMTESEIAEMASGYGVSIAAYLAGLDNGFYLSKTAKKAKEQSEARAQTISTLGTDGVGGLVGAGLTGKTDYHSDNRTDHHHPAPPPGGFPGGRSDSHGHMTHSSYNGMQEFGSFHGKSGASNVSRGSMGSHDGSHAGPGSSGGKGPGGKGPGGKGPGGKGPGGRR